jgi:hypothetical protein
MKQRLNLLVLVLLGCSAGGGGTKGPSDRDPNDNPLGAGGSGFMVDDGPMFADDLPTSDCSADCTDFPAEPILDTESGAIPAEAPSLFGAPDSFGSSGPCVREPELSEEATGKPGVLFPANWVEPRFRWTPLAGEDLFEIRLSTDKERNDLVAYTRATTWIMPKEIWQALAKNVHVDPIVVTIRGINSGAPGTPSGTRGHFTIAPVNAGGSMVYWASTSSDVAPTTSLLYGFSVGEDNVVEALTIPDVAQTGILHENGYCYLY